MAEFLINGEFYSVTLDTDNDRISLVGETYGTIGQMQDSIPVIPQTERLLAYWEKYHLEPATLDIVDTITDILNRLDGENINPPTSTEPMTIDHDSVIDTEYVMRAYDHNRATGHIDQAIEDLVDNYATDDWRYGTPLVADNHWDDYAHNEIEVLSLITAHGAFNDAIDWDKAYDILRSDWEEITFDNETYWIRSN